MARTQAIQKLCKTCGKKKKFKRRVRPIGGGNEKPQKLLDPFGIELSDPQFWQKGYDFVSGLFEELKQLTVAQRL